MYEQTFGSPVVCLTAFGLSEVFQLYFIIFNSTTTIPKKNAKTVPSLDGVSDICQTS